MTDIAIRGTQPRLKNARIRVRGQADGSVYIMTLDHRCAARVPADIAQLLLHGSSSRLWELDPRAGPQSLAEPKSETKAKSPEIKEELKKKTESKAPKTEPKKKSVKMAETIPGPKPTKKPF